MGHKNSEGGRHLVQDIRQVADSGLLDIESTEIVVSLPGFICFHDSRGYVIWMTAVSGILGNPSLGPILITLLQYNKGSGGELRLGENAGCGIILRLHRHSAKEFDQNREDNYILKNVHLYGGNTQNE